MALASTSEVAIFIESNMGTRIALPLYPHITPSDFKRELEMTHLSCFPEMGEIRVVGLKVKRKSTYYHLPESMLLRHVFQDPRHNRFIRMDLRPLNDLDGPASAKCEAVNVWDQMNSNSFAELENIITDNGADSTRMKQKEKKVVRNNYLLENASDGRMKEYISKFEKGTFDVTEQIRCRVPSHELEQDMKWSSSSFVQTPSDTSLQAVSVSGIIEKFFSNSDDSATTSQVLCEDTQCTDDQLRSERDGHCSNVHGTLSAHLTARTAKRTSPFKLTPIRTPGNNLKTPQVGKRLVNASNCLGHEQKGASFLCQVKSRKLSELCSSVRSLVFEMSDNGD